MRATRERVATSDRDDETGPALQVRNLRTEFSGPGGSAIRVIDDLSFDLEAGKALAIVGESGSGKSVAMRSLLGLLPKTARVTSGSVMFRGTDLLAVSPRQLQSIRGRRIGMVFQSAMEALNPTLTLERQLTEHLIWHGLSSRAEARSLAVRTLGDVGIPRPERAVTMYPFQLSGGMRQRAMIAMAIITRPEILVADEPTTALDVTVQRQILDLLSSLRDAGMGVIMITHDLGVARAFCDDTVVLYAGRIAERAPTLDLLAHPRHPYARGLLDCSIEVGGSHRPLVPIPGSPPDMAHRPPGCAFAPRCPLADAVRCLEPQEMLSVGSEHDAACWRVRDDRN